MFDIFEIHSKYDIKAHNFPINHDCILKVYFNDDVRFSQYFSCCSQDAASIVILFKKLSRVFHVQMFSVYDIHDINLL